jgi:transcriptional regulator with XRE-family HTH domain
MVPSNDIIGQKSRLLKEKSFYTIVGPTLGFYRERKSLKQKDLARTLGISRQTLVTWEGKVQLKISHEHLEILKKSLNVTLEDLTKDINSGSKFEGDIMNHPLVKSLQDQIKVQSEMIELLKGSKGKK